MKQEPKSQRTRQAQALAALVCPVCELCGAPTRFVGLEAIANNDAADLCTYECTACGHAQANVIPRSGDSGASQLRR